MKPASVRTMIWHQVKKFDRVHVSVCYMQLFRKFWKLWLSQYTWSFDEAVLWKDNSSFWRIQILWLHLHICTLGKFVLLARKQTISIDPLSWDSLNISTIRSFKKKRDIWLTSMTEDSVYHKVTIKCLKGVIDILELPVMARCQVKNILGIRWLIVKLTRSFLTRRADDERKAQKSGCSRN